METAAKCARMGERILRFLALILILLLLSYCGYSLWDTAMTYLGAFTSSDLLQYKPTSGSDNLSLEELQKINPDVCAWLTIDGTHIDYPVVRGEDNLEYINKNVFGAFSLSGAIFLDSGNSLDFFDRYSLIYGHHMDHGAMFGDILDFTDQSYFESHTTGTLYRIGETDQISLFACVKVNASDDVIYHPTAQKEMSTLLKRIQDTAVQYREIDIASNDSIIGFSTCADTETNGRAVLFGRLSQSSQAHEGGS